MKKYFSIRYATVRGLDVSTTDLTLNERDADGSQGVMYKFRPQKQPLLQTPVDDLEMSPDAADFTKDSVYTSVARLESMKFRKEYTPRSCSPVPYCSHRAALAPDRHRPVGKGAATQSRTSLRRVSVPKIALAPDNKVAWKPQISTAPNHTRSQNKLLENRGADRRNFASLAISFAFAVMLSVPQHALGDDLSVTEWLDLFIDSCVGSGSSSFVSGTIDAGLDLSLKTFGAN